MIKGFGIDIIEIDRIENSVTRFGSRFLDRIFTEHEQTYCEAKINKFQHYAVRFAGKEALLKALGKGLRDGIAWKDIEFTNDELGMPKAICSGKCVEHLENLHVDKILCSFSHSGNNAVAAIIFEGE